MKKVLLISSVLVMIVVTLGFLGYRPIDSSRENCEDISGVVWDVSEAGTKDAVIRLAGDQDIYYINRVLENRFTLTGLRKEIIGKQVTISYAKHWSLSPAKFSKHIGQLQLGREVIYSEFK